MRSNLKKLTLGEIDELITKTRGKLETVVVGNDTYEVWNVPGVSTNSVSTPQFSSDTELAVMLFEEMPWPRRIAYHVHSSALGYKDRGRPAYLVSSENYEAESPRDVYYHAVHACLAVAICLAWLRWKTGVDYEVIK